MSQRANIEVVFFIALGENQRQRILYILFLDFPKKRSDDILDIRLRQKYDNITFKSVADLRRVISSQESLNALQLIKSYLKKIKSHERKDQV